MKEDFWKGKNVFVTGANGFIGSWLTKALVKKEANVVILIRDFSPKSTLALMGEVYSQVKAVVYGCLTDYQTVGRVFNEYEIDSCFHLAAQAIVGVANKSPLSTFESNIRGTWNVLEAARNFEVERIVVASSDKAYGEHEELPYREEYCLNALHPYDASKACADILARTYFATYDLPVAVARCANTYGGGDLNFSRIIPDTIRSILLGKNPVIRSDGTPVRDYMYILDAVGAYLILGEGVGEEGVVGRAFNFGTEKPISVLDLVNKIIAISGRTALRPVIKGKGKTKGEIDKQYLLVDRARKILGWKSRYGLEEGLKKTIEWYTRVFEEGLINF